MVLIITVVYDQLVDFNEFRVRAYVSHMAATPQICHQLAYIALLNLGVHFFNINGFDCVAHSHAHRKCRRFGRCLFYSFALSFVTF